MEGKDEITKRLESEEGIINDTEKLRALHTLRDHVFHSRTEVFNWNIVESVSYTATKHPRLPDDLTE